jgi:hypothetical protein
MDKVQGEKQNVTSFCEINNSYPVFQSELDFIGQRRSRMGQAGDLMKMFAPYPTTENQLVGLCLSGGGIRSATFSLGLIQALFRSGLIKRVDYLSTVSGGGYIGSCLTALLSSDISNIDNKIKESSKEKKVPLLWDECNFPFAMPKRRKMNENSSNSSQPATQCPSAREESATAEKNPVRRLRYYSNYLTAEGNFVKKYFGPVLAFGRGFLFNLLLILPIFILAAVLLTAIYKVPDLRLGSFQNYFQMERLDKALRNYSEAIDIYELFILNSSKDLPSDLSLSKRIDLIKAIPNLFIQEQALKNIVSEAQNAIRNEWLSMLVLPVIAIGFVLVADLIFMIRKKWAFLNYRFNFSYKSSIFLIVLFIVPLAIQIFGAAIVYWNHYQVPNEIAFVSLLSLFGPKLLTFAKKEGKEKPFLTKMLLPFGLMLLAPVLLLYLTGWMVHLIWIRNLNWGCIALLIIVGLIILWLPSRLLNINKISLHCFYRDRLSRAFLIQHDSVHPKKNSVPFEKLFPNDKIQLADIYNNELAVGPYHIINTNLNQTKSLPREGPEGVFRTGESFIFSKYWCGSNITGYVATEEYQKKDQHIDLATATAISGAAANIGMGFSNMPVLRLLMALLNIRLGYWAPNPKSASPKPVQLLFGKTPGTWTLMKEMLGMYSRKSSYINLSDGGHFDNLGVYELLRRRCKYIIVADAEADPEMKFQALAYIIRLARIDFGIIIDINLSDLKQDKDSKLSRKHCVVGSITYPETANANEEIGYLFYCKSSLTGDEPQHLHEYRVKHPSFPHQTTADQWFDEQQFEAYRELGYHIARESVRPISPLNIETSIEDSFVQLRQHWYPSRKDMEDRSTHFARELNRIIEHIKNDNKLQFMDAQMFPEWESLMSESSTPLGNINFWLPDNNDEIRAGFYACNLMIQFMENVYIDLDLDESYDHPSNRGWMNLFMHWSWSGMFRVTYAISACTFGGEFQKFCKNHLKLDLGEISVDLIDDEMNQQIDSSEGETNTRLLCEKENKLSKVFKPVELKKIKEYFCISHGLPQNCYSFNLIVKNPMNKKQRKNFVFGFALTRYTDNSCEILYFRVQDHLRRIGLGRTALGMLIENIIREPREIWKNKKKFELIEMIQSGAPVKYFYESESFTQMLNSVKSEKKQQTDD